MASKFRNSLTQKEGHEPAKIVQGSVININLKKWTIDIVGQYDRKKYFGIQVGSPYLHHSNGEGISCFPEVGATAMVCLASDSSPPFVMSYVMAPETVNDSATDAPSGTSSHAQQPVNATSSSFDGGRPAVQPGDIWMRTRDNNFVILHRGGVLQIGATELSQRIFIPLNNLITDIDENYEHHNSNGSIVWGLQDGPSLTQYPSQFMQTFRVFASDQYADVKLAIGKVYSPVPEPDGGVTLAKAGVAQGDDGQGSNPIIYEVTVSPQGFVAESGAPAGGNTSKNSVMKFTFDRTGNTLMRTEGNLYFQVTKVLTLDVTGAISIQTQDAFALTAVDGIDMDGGAYTNIKGKIVRLNAGSIPVARQGDLVSIPTTLPFYIGTSPVPVVTPAGPGTIAPGTPIFLSSKPIPGMPLVGTITKCGNSTVQV
jgi:hypothetical protein